MRSVRLGALGLCLGALTLNLTGGASSASVSAVSQTKVNKPSPTCSSTYLNSAKSTNTLFQNLSTPYWAGADGGFSAGLPDGRSVWFYGDTFQGGKTKVGGYSLGTRLLGGNTMLVTKGACIVGYSKPGSSALPNEGAVGAPSFKGHKLWPTTAIYDGGKLWVFDLRVRVTGLGAWDWVIDGTEARGLDPKNLNGNQAIAHIPGFTTSTSGIWWGTSVLSYKGYVYVLGSQQDKDPWVWGWNQYIARFPSGNINSIKKWQFWNGTTWGNDEKASKLIISGKDGPSGGTLMTMPGGGFGLVSKRNNGLGQDVALWRADTLTGTWDKGKTLLTLPPSDKPAKGTTWYCAFAHVQLEKPGKLLISVSRNGDWAYLASHANFYKPVFFDVTIPPK